MTHRRKSDDFLLEHGVFLTPRISKKICGSPFTFHGFYPSQLEEYLITFDPTRYLVLLIESGIGLW